MKDWLEIHKFKMILIFLITILGIYFYYFSSNKKEVTFNQEVTPLIEEQEQVKDEEKIEINIMVDVKGEVLEPGVYHATQGERVMDLIRKAGGFTKDANQNQVNLSQHIADEMVIFVPKIGEEGAVIQNEGEIKGNNLVNINKATEIELQTLPGIGPSKATAIIEYREKNSGFKSIEDLKEISGIGEKTFEKLESSISVK
ncbi:helix-hairpin-helix domain-containing protein [Neobacillus sp. D3-1R]|uniref:helix-hairpin-helix domain-containing protein n=1 Tax=Neobacillus sp. D3-1R TaxID=3445778 RepID=UPI003FA124C5